MRTPSRVAAWGWRILCRKWWSGLANPTYCIAGGGGGTGGTTGTGSGLNTGGLPLVGGERLGIPNWLPFPQGNIWGALLPVDPSCEFGPCVPIGNRLAPAVAAIGACAINPACRAAVTALITATVLYLPQIVQTTKDIVDWTSQFSKCLHQFIEDTKACQDAYPPGPAREGCYKAARQIFDLCKAGGSIH